MTAAPSAIRIGRELSESWVHVLAGKIPEFIDVFCLLCIDAETKRYRCWGYYESTAETIGVWAKRFPGSGVDMVASVRVPVRQRSDDGLKAARTEAAVMLNRAVWKSPESGYVAFRNKLAEDLAFWKAERDAGRNASGITVERVDSETYQQLLKESNLINR